VSCRDDVEVIESVVVLVVLGTSQEFLVVHDLEVCSLNGVVGIKGIGNPMFTIVISTSSYLHFISYAVTLASFYTIGFDWRRLSEGSIRRPERGGSEWEPIKILLEGD
jgi:hypothetical protein